MREQFKGLLRNLLVGIGKIIGFLLPIRNSSGIFFFFTACPQTRADGAAAVHQRIVSSLKDLSPWVFFSMRWQNEPLSLGFIRSPGFYCLSAFIANRAAYWCSVGILASLINGHSRPVLFGDSFLYYSLVPYLKDDATAMDILHSFNGECERKALPVLDQLDLRVVIDYNSLKNMQHQYQSLRKNSDLLRRVVVIENATHVPDQYPEKEAGKRLKVIYVGRGTEEKRVYLVARIAALCHQRNVPADFLLVGPSRQEIEEKYLSYCEPLGTIEDPGRLASIYRESHVILLTSRYEGFPLSLMEGMAHGVVPVSTDVGGISRHVIPQETGFLIANGVDESIVIEATSIISLLCQDRELLERLSRAAFERARECFSMERFAAMYRQLLLGSLPSDRA